MGVTSGLALCLIGSVLCVLLAGYKPEYSLAVAICVGAVVLGFILSEILPVATRITNLVSATGLDEGYFKIMLKCLGVCYITDFVADICRDFGQSALASKAELLGKVVIFMLCLPLLESVIEIALSFIGEV